MTWIWKNWLGYAAIGVAVVLVSFIVEWHIRTGWEIFWLDGFIKWWGDFVMFGWVADYQTLLAGMLAAGAASMVLFATIMARAHAVEDRDRAEREAFVTAVRRTRAACRAAVMTLAIGKTRSEVAATAIDAIDREAMAIALHVPKLADTIQFHVASARLHSASAAFAGRVDVHVRRAAGRIDCIYHYLSDPAPFMTENFRRYRHSVPPSYKGRLQWTRMEDRDQKSMLKLIRFRED